MSRSRANSNYLVEQTGCIDADLNSSLTKFKRRRMFLSVKLLAKYVIITECKESQFSRVPFGQAVADMY